MPVVGNLWHNRTTCDQEAGEQERGVPQCPEVTRPSSRSPLNDSTPSRAFSTGAPGTSARHAIAQSKLYLHLSVGYRAVVGR